MDRVSIRSFRASDLAERRLKDLARSRLDTTREVVFQALGHRFFEAREDATRIAILFREDAFHAPDGHLTRMALRVEPHFAERLGRSTEGGAFRVSPGLRFESPRQPRPWLC